MDQKPQQLEGPKRDKTWEERTDQERIQALRQEVMGLRDLVGYLRRDLYKAAFVAEQHEHGGDGKVLVHPGHGNAGQAEMSGSRRDPLA